MAYVWLYEYAEVYFRRQAGFYVGFFAEISSYVDSYEGVELYDEIYLGVCAELYVYVNL